MSSPQRWTAFFLFGIPQKVKTDNGPPFSDDQFHKFAEYLGFKHMKITPLWPQANATAESFMRTIGTFLRIAGMNGIPWKQELDKFLREYRSTPHSTTDKSPAELLFNREMRTKIPTVNIDGNYEREIVLPKPRGKHMQTAVDMQHLTTLHLVILCYTSRKWITNPHTIPSLTLWEVSRVPWSQQQEMDIQWPGTPHLKTSLIPWSQFRHGRRRQRGCHHLTIPELSNQTLQKTFHLPEW